MRVITNPVSRSGKGEKVMEAVTRALDEKGVRYTVSRTSKTLDALDIAKEAAASGEDLVICVGGDGTVSEVAGGLVNSGTTLAIIPAGTGDDFARYLGIPKDPSKALDIALNGSLREVDAALANDRVFINAAGSGFDVLTLHHTLRYKKIFHGLLPYVLGVLSALLGYKPMDTVITHGGEKIEGKMTVVSVANGRYIGGGMSVAPFADASDGLFEVTYVDNLPRFKIPFLLAGFVNGSYLKLAVAHSFRSDELTVTVSDSSLQLDGEILEEKTVHYKILPKAIKVKVPKRFPSLEG